MKKIVFAIIAALLLISCAAVQQPATPAAQAPSADKIQARLTELEPQVAAAALEKVKALPAWTAYEEKRKVADAEGKKVEATPEWAAYLKLMNEQAYLKRLQQSK
ncbi:MAG: hypothetical protein M0Z43_02320 [Acidithiobacillus sp.]|nr:hypothetical protein [Acidithiobacillus sp.]